MYILLYYPILSAIFVLISMLRIIFSTDLFSVPTIISKVLV